MTEQTQKATNELKKRLILLRMKKQTTEVLNEMREVKKLLVKQIVGDQNG